MKKSSGKDTSAKSSSTPETGRMVNGDSSDSNAPSGAGDTPVIVYMMEPQQSENERREIRHSYRRFIGDMKENERELTNPASDSLNERLNEADDLFNPVKNTREAVLDSAALGIIASYGRQKAQAVQMEVARYQPTEYMRKLMAFMIGTEQVDSETAGEGMTKDVWGRLGKGVQHFFKKSPPFHFMFGSFIQEEVDLHVTRRTVNKDLNKDNNKETVTEPEQLPSFEGETEEATTAEVEKVLGILQSQYQKAGRVPICYFDFVINPKSFGETVENIFYVSFLVRDGLAEVKLDDDKLPVIEPVSTEFTQGQSDGPRKQVIISISKQEWKEIVDTFQITEPLIPSRGSAEGATA